MLILNYLIIFGFSISLAYSQIFPIPQQDTELAKGFLDGVNFIDILSLRNCTNEFRNMITKVEKINLDDTTELLSEIFQIIHSISNIISYCPEIKNKLDSAINFINKSYHLPGKFLNKGFDNMFRFFTLRKLWDLKNQLKKDDLTEAGKTLGEICKEFINTDFLNNI